MSVRISTDTHELDRLAKRLAAVLEVAQKPQLLLLQLAKGLVQQTEARIEYEKTSPGGTAWAPWSPAYAATRDEGDSLLIDTRELQDSFQTKVTRTGLAIWTDVEYAGVHQFGGGNNIPARPFLGLSDENVRNIDDWLAGILLGAVKGAKVQQTTRKKIRGKRR